MDSNYPTYAMPQKPDYSKTDSVFAWLSLIFAFFFCHTIPIWQNPLGGFLLIFALFIVGFVILAMKKAKFTAGSILSSISALLLCFAFLLSESPFLLFLSYSYCLGSFCFLIYATLGNRVEKGFSNYIYIDYIKILFILPFWSYISIFSAFSSKSTHKSSRFVLRILIGIAIAVIPTLLVFGFLSYDDGFMNILDDIFSFKPDNIAQWIMSIFFTLPLAMYGYGLYTSSRKGILQDKITAEKCDNIQKKVRILPQITAVVATFPIIFLYVIFFISQWKYFVSGFTGVLPENFSYAEYARQGFFELCAVSVINLLCITAIAVFIGRGRKNKAVVLKLLTIVFCLCTLILISTAIAKLVMYIQYYGLTQKRIYAMWMMAVIALVFLVIALGQFIPRIRIVAMSYTIFIAMFIPLALCNINAITAQYNTERYLAGTLEEMDTELMEELGDSAIPSLVKLVNTIDPEENPELKLKIDIILFQKKAQLNQESFSVFAFNIPSAKAKAAIKDYTPPIPPAGIYQLGSYHFDLEEEDGGYQSHTYSDNEIPPILIIGEDFTGTLTFEDQVYSVQIENCQLICDGQVFDITYDPYERYSDDLTLVWDNEDDAFGKMYFEATENSPPAGTYAVSSVGTADGSTEFYSSQTADALAINEDGTGSFYYKETRYDIRFEQSILTIGDRKVAYRYIAGSEDEEPLLTLYWSQDGINTIALRPVS